MMRTGLGISGRRANGIYCSKDDKSHRDLEKAVASWINCHQNLSAIDV